MNELVLIRHGETEWSADGRHTSHTDVELTERGRAQGEAAGAALRDRDFARVLTSPLRRARDTAVLAGYGDVAQETPELVEWDYGDYEGATTPEIREQVPGWTVWTHESPGGERADDVGARADRVLAALADVEGDVLVFAHGHLLRVLAARWLGLPARDGRLFVLSTATLSVLGYEHGTPAILTWNAPGPAAYKP